MKKDPKLEDPKPEGLQGSYREPAPGGELPPVKPSKAPGEQVFTTTASAARLFDGRVVVDLPPVYPDGKLGMLDELSEVDPYVLLKLVREAIEDGRLILEETIHTSGLLGIPNSQYAVQKLLDKKVSKT